MKTQEKKQIKAIQNQGQVKKFKRYTYDDKDSPLIWKQKEIFKKLADKRLEEITKLDNKVNSDDLIYKYKGPTANEEYDEFDNGFDLIDKMREGDAKNRSNRV